MHLPPKRNKQKMCYYKMKWGVEADTQSKLRIYYILFQFSTQTTLACIFIFKKKN